MCNINIKLGNCISLLQELPEKSVNMIFADPPYNLSGEKHLTVKSGKMVACNKGNWDVIENIHEFNERWIKECIRVLKDDGTIWISGTLHNHPSIGVLLKKLNLWIINDVIWYKRNAPPLLSKTRLAPSTELIWIASKSKKYFFDYDTAKILNGGKQMRNLWEINAQRHITKHPTEKPEILLERIILLGSKEGSIVLDPFTGSGTTGVVAKRLKRNFIGFEIDPEFYEIAKNRIGGEKVNAKAIYSEKISKDEQLSLALEKRVIYHKNN
ncbi:MAG: site-specific DNA-methyltransferase [Bacteroidales bacterium]|nr:site-specific DNA-methyltransferase [Bacteroidales bacterium]